MDSYKTGFFAERIIQCGSIEELKDDIIKLLKDQRLLWSDKINQILSDCTYSVKTFAQLCNVSEMTVRKWMKGALPQTRDMYICIGFAAGYGLDEMNTFLETYGRCPKLYVKSLEDSVCMFVLQSSSIEHTYDNYLKTLEVVKKEFENQLEGDESDLTQNIYGTTEMLNSFVDILSEAEMIQFAKENVPAYATKYNRLYDFIMEYVYTNYKCENNADTSETVSFGEMATEENWPQPLKRCVVDISKRRWFPQRQKLLALGIRLNMDVEAINRMLSLAQMKPLYAKSPFEAAVMWAIEDFKISSVDGEIYAVGGSELCEYVKSVLDELNLDELNIERKGIYSISDFYTEEIKRSPEEIKRSPFFYVGDKYKLMPQLRTLFPQQIDTYFEPFCGGGSSFLNTRANNYIVNDIDEYVIKLHQFFKENAGNQDAFLSQLFSIIDTHKLSCSFRRSCVPDELKQQFPKTYYAEYNKVPYTMLREEYNKNQTDMAMLYVLLIYGFNHMIRFNSKGDFNLPVGNVDFNTNVYEAICGYMEFLRTHHVSYSCMDFQTFIRTQSFGWDDFVFCDPPYLISQSEYNKHWDDSCDRLLYQELDRLHNKGVHFGLTNLLHHKGRTNNILMDWMKKYKVYYVRSNYISYNDNSIKSDSVEVYVTNG